MNKEIKKSLKVMVGIALFNIAAAVFILSLLKIKEYPIAVVSAFFAGISLVIVSLCLFLPAKKETKNGPLVK